MRVIITIAVRNPDWYWSKEELQEAGEYRKEWEVLNEDKVEKYLPSEAFEIAFDVRDIKENRNGTFDIRFVSEDKSQSISHSVKQVTVVEFIGTDQSISIVISNSLIHQYIAARQREYKYYVYFYLKENTPYERLNQFIWLSDGHRQELEEELGIQIGER